MRICMVCPSFPPQEITCGVGDYTRCLADEMVRQGEELTVVTSVRYSGKSEENLAVQPIVKDWTCEVAWNWAKDPCTVPIDLVHIQYTPDLYGSGVGFKFLPFFLRLRRRRVPVIVTFHTLFGPSLWTKVNLGLLLLSSNFFISASEEVSALMRRMKLLSASCWSEIPIGSSIPFLTSQIPLDLRTERKSLGVLEQGFLIVHFGMIYPGKGLETLFEAFPRVLSLHPTACLVLVGDTRSESLGYQAQLKSLADRFGISSSIVWTGSRSKEDVGRLLRVADLFVVPFDGGASIRRSSLMAGFAQGLPIVSTSPSVESSYLKDGGNIALVPPKDPEALASRINTLIDNAEERAQLAKGALRVAERVSWSTIARQTRDVYAQLLRR